MGTDKCVKVAVTGAAGRVAYALLPLIASGRVFGAEQRVQLKLLDIEAAMRAMEGVAAELTDCAFPLLDEIVFTADPAVAFKDVDVAILCGSFPLKKGMVRKDLLAENARMFNEQGRILGEVAAPDCRVCVVSNPANTIALLVLNAAGGKLKPKQVTALSRLDHNRLTSFLASRAQVTTDDVRNCIVWGNHSASQVPDVNSATIKGIPARDVVKDDAYLDGELMKKVQDRGIDIFKEYGLSSALSVGTATADHMRDWYFGTPEGTHVSMIVHTDGNPYGVPGGLFSSFPVTCKAGEWQIVPGLTITPHVAKCMEATVKDLEEERSLALGQRA